MSKALSGTVGVFLITVTSSLLAGCLVEESLTVEKITPVPGGFEIATKFGGEGRLSGLDKRADQMAQSLTVEPCRVAYSDSWEPEPFFVQPIVRDDEFGISVVETWDTQPVANGFVVKVTQQLYCGRYYDGTPWQGEEPEIIDWSQACVTATVMEQFVYKVLARSRPGDLAGVADICAAQG